MVTPDILERYQVLELNAKLSQFSRKATPFSNVSGFHMCIGNNVMPKCESLHTLSSLPYHIMEIPNNDDHYQAQNNIMRLDYRGLLEHLRDKNPAYYYEKVLVPNGRTLKDFIQSN